MGNHTVMKGKEVVVPMSPVTWGGGGVHHLKCTPLNTALPMTPILRLSTTHPVSTFHV